MHTLTITTNASNDKPIPAYEKFQWINHPIVRNVLSKFFKTSNRGRKGYDKTLLFLWLMYKRFTGCTYRDLESITGVDYTTFIKFRQRLIKQNWFKTVFEQLSKSAIKHLANLKLILDSSFVETYSKKDEVGSEYNGYKQKNGFKLHQMLDYKSRLPLLQDSTPGARADIVWGLKLIRAAPKNWDVKGLLADKAYDADELVMTTKNKWNKAQVGIQVRQTSHLKRTGKPESIVNRKAKESTRNLKQTFLNKRTEIERYFSRIKRVFRLGEDKTRHLKNFRNNCYMVSIMVILEWMVKQTYRLALFTRLTCLLEADNAANPSAIPSRSYWSDFGRLDTDKGRTQQYKLYSLVP